MKVEVETDLWQKKDLKLSESKSDCLDDLNMVNPVR